MNYALIIFDFAGLRPAPCCGSRPPPQTPYRCASGAKYGPFTVTPGLCVLRISVVRPPMILTNIGNSYNVCIVKSVYIYEVAVCAM